MIDISAERTALREELVELRRYPHAYPGQPWQGFNTQKKIYDYLNALGIPYVKVCKTGVIATVMGKHSAGKVLGTRADIDALPVIEPSEVAWEFENEDCMHACGHDTHITILLDTARLLKKMEDELTITVKLLFQPAEELIADSGVGLMKDEPGALTCDRLIVMYIWSKIPVGYASLRCGPVTSAADTSDFYMKGKDGHGALLQQTVDPIVAGAELVVSLQRLASRELNPLEPTVTSVTSFVSGTTLNVIPGETHLMGIARASNLEIRDCYPEMLRRIADGVVMVTRTEIQPDCHPGPLPIINDDACVDTGRRAAERVFGKEHLLDWEQQMGGEDFTKYKASKCLLFLGGGFSEEEWRCPQHSLYFDIDESVLQLGVRYFCECIRGYEKEV